MRQCHRYFRTWHFSKTNISCLYDYSLWQILLSICIPSVTFICSLYSVYENTFKLLSLTMLLKVSIAHAPIYLLISRVLSWTKETPCTYRLSTQRCTYQPSKPTLIESVGMWIFPIIKYNRGSLKLSSSYQYVAMYIQLSWRHTWKRPISALCEHESCGYIWVPLTTL